MKKVFIFGMTLALLLLIIGIWSKEMELFSLISGGIGLFSLLLSGLLSGAFVSGSQNSANYHSEQETDRRKRSKYMGYFLVFGLSHFVVAIILTALK